MNVVYQSKDASSGNNSCYAQGGRYIVRCSSTSSFTAPNKFNTEHQLTLCLMKCECPWRPYIMKSATDPADKAESAASHVVTDDVPVPSKC